MHSGANILYHYSVKTGDALLAASTPMPSPVRQ